MICQSLKEQQSVAKTVPKTTAMGKLRSEEEGKKVYRYLSRVAPVCDTLARRATAWTYHWCDRLAWHGVVLNLLLEVARCLCSSKQRRLQLGYDARAQKVGLQCSRFTLRVLLKNTVCKLNPPNCAAKIQHGLCSCTTATKNRCCHLVRRRQRLLYFPARREDTTWNHFLQVNCCSSLVLLPAPSP